VPALVALPLSSDRTILAPATATRDAVAPNLTRNGCFITPQPLGNLPLGNLQRQQPRYLHAILKRKMIRSHRWDSV
jgi:hypothetical protein